MFNKTKLLLFCVIAVCLLTPATTAHTVQLPAVYPLVNILLPLLNNVYNLLLSLLSIFDTLPPSVSCLIPVDLGAVETSLLKLYSQALAIVNFLRSLPEYAAGAAPNTSPSAAVSLQGVRHRFIFFICKSCIWICREERMSRVSGGSACCGQSSKSGFPRIKAEQCVITSLLGAIADITEDTLVGIGGGLLPGLLKLVVMVLQALLNLLI